MPSPTAPNSELVCPNNPVAVLVCPKSPPDDAPAVFPRKPCRTYKHLHLHSLNPLIFLSLLHRCPTMLLLSLCPAVLLEKRLVLVVSPNILKVLPCCWACCPKRLPVILLKPGVFTGDTKKKRFLLRVGEPRS